MKKEVRRKIALLLAILMILSSFPMGEVSAENSWDHVETFDGFVASGNSYTKYEFKGVHNGRWTATGARGAVGAGHTVDDEGVLLGGKTADNSQLTTTVQEGIGRISVDVKKAFTSGNKRNIGLYVNEDTTPVATIDATNATTPVTMTADINLEGVVKITLKHVTTTSNRAQVTIDNVKWTNYSTAQGGGTQETLSISPAEFNFDYYSTDKVTATKQLKLMGVPSGATVTWSSDDEDVATVDSTGLVTAMDMGVANITAKVGDESVTSVITVPDAAPCSIKYYLDEGLIQEYKSEIVPSESSITAPTNPTKAGYTFDGWYWKTWKEEEAVFDFNLGVLEDANIYAKWTETQEDILTIAEARVATGEVTTKGIVTFFDNNTVVIQDETAGIAIYRKTDVTAVLPDLAVGDEIKLSGTIGAYNGLTQLQNPKNIGRISQNKALPEPQEITIETLLSKGEEYESERVLIREAIIGTYSPNEFNTMLTQNGKTVAMFKIPGLSEGIVENDKVNVTAVASQHYGYQLRVAKIEDIVKVAGGDPVAPTTYKSDIFTEEFLKEHDAMLIPEVLKLPNETPSTVVGVAVYSYSGGSALIIQDYVNGEIVGYQIYGPTENVQPGDIVVVSGNRVKFYDTDETSNITAMQMIDPQALNMTDEQRAKYDLVCQPQLVTKDMIAQNQTKYYNEYLRINDLTLPEHDGGSGQVYFKYDDGSKLQSYRIPEYPIGTKADEVVDILCAGAVHSGRFQVRLDTYKDYIIKNDVLAPFVVVPEFLDAKAGQDYIFQVDIMDNVEVTGAKAILVNADNLEIPLQRDEITGAYKGTIAKENFKDLTELELKFEATDGKQISSGYYKKPFIYGTSENITENIKIPVDSRPFVKETAPKTNEEVLDTLKPQITATILNPVEGMKVTLTLNGVAHDMTFADGKAVFTPAADLQEGKITAQISITDARGEKIADDYDWSFYIGKAQYRHYYGQIHSHTDYSDGAGSLKDALDHASNADQIDFFSITDHSNKFDAAGNLGTFDNEDSGLRSTIDSTRSKWEEYKETIANYTADDFLPFYGFEMTWTSSGANYGHINTFNTMGFVSRNDPEFNNKESSAGIIKYYEALTTLENSFSQFNHPGKTFGNFDEFGHYDARYDAELQLVEVGNGEGPIHGSGYYPSYEQYTKALDKGWHVAPSNNQDNHKGKWGDANDGRNVAIADSLTLTAIMDAVDNHRWYSTEDKNLKINYTLNGNIMGSKLEIPSEEKMRIEVEVIDPDAEDIVGKVEVISNGGKVLGTENINSNSGTANFTVRNSGTYYYIRITQVDKDIAVTAPVWTKKVVAADIDSVVKNTQSEEVGQPVTLTTVFNNPTEKDITISKIEYVVKESGEALATVDTNLPTLTKNQKTNIEQVITPATVGLQTVEVKIYTDSSTPYTKGIKLNVYPEYMQVTSIADVQRAEEEKQFMIEGVLTSNAGGFDANTAFFDSAYVQDATGGINIFPINNDFSEGTKVRIKGTTDSYEGEHQLNISTIEKIEGPIEKVEPKELKTGEVKDNLGLLVKVEGEVKEVNKENGVIADLVLDDGSGSIRVFINGYIGKLNSADKTMPEFKIGDRAEATGLSSIDPEGNRIRVRNRDDVKLMEDVQDDPNTPSEPNKPNEPNKPDKPTKPGNIYPTINDVWKDDEEVFEPHYYYTGSLVSWKTTDKAEDEVTDYWNKVEDIKGHWAEDIIKEVLKRGLMDLKGGKFMPDAPTTRVDVVKAIAKLEKVDPKQYMGKSLSDIDSESLESGYINWAVEKGIINGYEDETFKPEREITREEIAKILNRYVENLNKNFPTKESIDFKDFEDIADWAKKDVNKAVERGLLRGRDTGEFDPRGDLTRAEVAQILFNIFSK